MSINLKIELILFSLFLIILIIYILKKGRIPIKYALIWLFSGLLILVSAIIPNFMETISKWLGFQFLSNMAFSLMFVIIIFIILALTIIISGQKEKIRLLIQEVSILKNEIKEIKEKR